MRIEKERLGNILKNDNYVNYEREKRDNMEAAQMIIEMIKESPENVKIMLRDWIIKSSFM